MTEENQDLVQEVKFDDLKKSELIALIADRDNTISVLEDSLKASQEMSKRYYEAVQMMEQVMNEVNNYYTKKENTLTDMIKSTLALAQVDRFDPVQRAKDKIAKEMKNDGN